MRSNEVEGLNFLYFDFTFFSKSEKTALNLKQTSVRQGVEMLGFFKLKYFFLSSEEQKGQNPNKVAENYKSAFTLQYVHYSQCRK